MGRAQRMAFDSKAKLKTWKVRFTIISITDQVGPLVVNIRNHRCIICGYHHLLALPEERLYLEGTNEREQLETADRELPLCHFPHTRGLEILCIGAPTFVDGVNVQCNVRPN